MPRKWENGCYSVSGPLIKNKTILFPSTLKVAESKMVLFFQLGLREQNFVIFFPYFLAKITLLTYYFQNWVTYRIIVLKLIFFALLASFCNLASKDMKVQISLLFYRYPVDVIQSCQKLLGCKICSESEKIATT